MSSAETLLWWWSACTKVSLRTQERNSNEHSRREDKQQSQAQVYWADWTNTGWEGKTVPPADWGRKWFLCLSLSPQTQEGEMNSGRSGGAWSPTEELFLIWGPISLRAVPGAESEVGRVLWFGQFHFTFHFVFPLMYLSLLATYIRPSIFLWLLIFLILTFLFHFPPFTLKDGCFVQVNCHSRCKPQLPITGEFAETYTEVWGFLTVHEVKVRTAVQKLKVAKPSCSPGFTPLGFHSRLLLHLPVPGGAGLWGPSPASGSHLCGISVAPFFCSPSGQMSPSPSQGPSSPASCLSMGKSWYSDPCPNSAKIFSPNPYLLLSYLLRTFPHTQTLLFLIHVPKNSCSWRERDGEEEEGAPLKVLSSISAAPHQRNGFWCRWLLGMDAEVYEKSSYCYDLCHDQSFILYFNIIETHIIICLL